MINLSGLGGVLLETVMPFFYFCASGRHGPVGDYVCRPIEIGSNINR
jgi:hypothetical protein